MPRTRFQKLPAARQAQIFETAAREFAANGYEGASINKILEAAQVSKGAAYYYFDDKADLFAATIEYYAQDMIGDLDGLIEQIGRDNFWSTFAAQYAAQYAYFFDRPWALGAVKAAGRLSPTTLGNFPALAGLFNQVQASLAALLQKGQALELVRTDLPIDLLVALFVGVDDASDRWLMEHWQEFTRDELLATARRVVDAIAAMFAPTTEITDD